MKFSRRSLLALAASAFSAVLAACTAPGGSLRPPRAARSLDGSIERIGLASCMDQTKPQPVWDAVLADEPHLFVFAGDNVYADMPYSRANLQRAYGLAQQQEGLQKLRRNVRHLAIWDDHDYGQNDGGADFPGKAEAKEEFLEYWKVPQGDPRRRREGLYHAEVAGPPNKRVQVIVLDTRWFRSPLKATDQRNAPGKERYVPDADPAKTLLGEAQWRWLEEQLRQPAEVRLIVSGIQVVVEGHGWERWGNLPRERERLYRLIASTGANGVVFLSGDRHVGALYREANGTPYPFYEMTSSGITHPWREAAEPGPNRLGELYTSIHYGLVEIDWARRTVALQLKDHSGELQRSRVIPLAELKATP
jgi:alkaline phosphatase D